MILGQLPEYMIVKNGDMRVLGLSLRENHALGGGRRKVSHDQR